MTERNVEVARGAWGSELPDWVVALAEECDRTSQTAVAKLIGYKGPVINAVLHRAYGVIDRSGIKRYGNLAAVEAATRGALMSATVRCPGLLRDLPRNDCLANQRLPYAATNHARVKLFMACRQCTHLLLHPQGTKSCDH